MFNKVVAGLLFRDEIRDRVDFYGRLKAVRLFYIEDYPVDEQTFQDFWLEARAQERSAKQTYARSLIDNIAASEE